jgi:RNA polymerase sigma-70 factor (ECF subfamily)
MSRPPSDAAVIRTSLADPAAFGAIFDRHASPVHGFLARRVGRDVADGLLGDVFCVAFERRATYRAESDSALPWLYGIAWNLAAKDLRQRGRQHAALGRLGAVPEHEDRIEERLDGAERRRQLRSALAALTTEERETVLLYAWEELSYEEIAVVLEIPVGTVRSRLNRARRRLRELLDASGEYRVTHG